MNGLEKQSNRYAECGTCTIMLVGKAYDRVWWFRIIREPLRKGMTCMAALKRIDLRQYPVRSEQCRGCLRFLKTGLKDHSMLFRALNRVINPLFDAAMARIVSTAEITESKRYAKEMTAPAAREETI